MSEKPNKLRVSIISGVVIGVVSAIPGINFINCCCCAGVILGGVLAVYLYRQEFTPEMQPMESSDAVILGVASGVVAAFAGTLLGLLIMVAFGDIAVTMIRSLLESLVERMEQNGGIPPETIDQLKNEIERSLTQSKTISGVLIDLFASLIIDPLFAMLGALIGYAFFKPKRIPETPPAPQG